MKQWIKDVLQDVGAELKHQAAFGAHEISAAIFNQSAFVMYPRGHHDDPAPPQQTQQIEEHQQSRGMEM